MNVLATVLLIFYVCVLAALALVYAVSGYPLMTAICALGAAFSVRTAWILWREIRDDSTDGSDR